MPEGPAAGPYVTDAQGNGDDIEMGGQAGEGSFSDTVFGADPRANVLARDIYTGAVIELEGIKVRLSGAAGSVGAITNTQRYQLHCTSYENFRRKEIGQMYLTLAPEQPVVQNSALPHPVRVQDTIGGFGNTPSAMCRAFNENVRRARERMGVVLHRTDLNLFQGNRNGRSPGMAISQATGHVLIFDNSGKQYIAMDGQRVTMNASELDTGQSLEGRSMMGFPAMKNPINDFVPQGTIVTPQPRLIPHVTKFMNMIMTVMDMVDLMTACAQAVKVMTSTKKGTPERAKAEDDVMKQARASRFEQTANRALPEGGANPWSGQGMGTGSGPGTRP